MGRASLAPLAVMFDDTTGKVSAYRNPITGLDEPLPSSGGEVLAFTAAKTLTVADHGGRTMLWNAAAGFTFTLPAATGSGAVFTFKVGVVATSSSHKVLVANTTDIIQGSVFTVSDGAAAVLGYNTAGTDDTVSLNGTTTGGLTRGDTIIITDMKAGVFSVTGLTSSSGTEATPFSATV